MVHAHEPDCTAAPPAPIDTARANASSTSLVRVIQNMTDEARSLIGAHGAVMRVIVDEIRSHVVSAISVSDQVADRKPVDATMDGFAVNSLIWPLACATRLTQEEVLAHPAWAGLSKSANQRPRLRGWLAIPLVNRSGRSFGSIELTDKETGDFSAEDEARLIRFAQIVALAVENAVLYQSAHAEKRVPHSSLPLHAEIAQALGKDDDLQVSMQACAAAVVSCTGAALVRIWVFHAGVMNLQASAGLPMHQEDARAHVPVGQFSIGHIARTRQPLLANCILDHPHIHDKEWSRREGLSAFAGFPLLLDNELQGVIVLYNRKPIPTPAIQALTAVAPDLALAIMRKRIEDGHAAAGAEHAVIISTLDGAIADWNRGAERYFGYCRAEAIGQPLEIFVPQDLLADHRDIMHHIAHGKNVARAETTRQHQSGRSIDVRLTVSTLRDAGGVPVGAVTVAHDLSEFKRLLHQTCAAQKMEVFGQLAGGVAHDFNNLLTVILGYSEIIVSRLTPNDGLRELLGEIRKAGERGETLTRQLLAFSRKSVVEPKVLDLNAVVSDTEKMLRRLIGEDILMTTIFAPSLKPVKLDPGQMQQVILNLAVNARDAMPRGGGLTIETANVSLDETYAANHPAVPPGDYVLFAMSDTGVGMNPATQARMFEPLFTTKGPGKGTGLGLTTVDSIVAQSGGHIEVFSVLGRGTTFNIYLPRILEALPLGKSDPYSAASPHGNETVLLVEDEDSVRVLARHVLELNGYTVLEAIHGDDAIRIAEKHAGPIHLLLTDVVMPHLGGRPLADRLLGIKPQLKVLFLSGYTNDAVVRHGVFETELGFLQKPFTTGALAQKVREVLDQPAR